MSDVAGFTWQDVKVLRPKWSKKRCEEVFENVRDNLHERLVEQGWEILEALVEWED